MFAIKSTFEGVFPKKYTCDGENVSPALEWTGAPSCKAFALIVEDPDAPMGTFVHWVLYNMPQTLSKLPEGIPKNKSVPGIGTQGYNDFEQIGYDGPCPPRGHGQHRYYFRLYALSKETSFEAGLTAKELKARISPLIVGTAEFMAKYGR
ncbi:phosphatidylethanolamine-binding protein [Candidatus Marsarchaeota G2 archaeon ECH_B_SAG-G16]|jgi:Raf kinase inhibitor-like YbhB/YbcL family protein|uniref:Phosphatidylethanolamine-binding protein n=2 Tax=Candidatus Marsarchaeota TaxID=1978152 RepID=A0A2R6AIV3_9ARCH|nr:MAG: phosphatidylethanolamine-binding protein [Candidatus Marsarchaeota G1 archaeon BE_D]PSO05774.1 MAG: phosphatidylethanolamine-binding protein [Candidatus Marsarchaeota G2 archaeon ECH_B_SAG-G16]